MNINYSSCTYTGSAHNLNENLHLIDEKLGLYIVCDGRGERGKGKIAAQMAIDFIHQSISSHKKMLHNFHENPCETNTEAITEMLETALHKSSYQIYKNTNSDFGIQKMGTNLVLALIIGENIFFAHVGNSRIYLQRDNDLHLLTANKKQNKIEKSSLELMLSAPGESNLHHSLNNALGSSTAIKIELLSMEISQRDSYVLCTNGIYDCLTEDAIKRSLLENDGHDQSSALINQIKKIKGKESATVIVITIPKMESSNTDKIAPQDKFKALKDISLFSLLDYKELAKVLSQMKNRKFLKDETIVTMGENGSEFYIILSGTAEVSIKNKVITELNKGDYFGELALIDKFPRSATVKANTNLDALVMDSDHFFKIINNERKIAIKLLWRFTKTLSSRLRKTDALISELYIDKNNPIQLEEIEFEFD